MPTRLLLEGPDIEALLQRVREEHGEDARIVQAERIRSGGIAGFFAKQRFELAVEVDLDELPGPVDLPAETLAELENDDEAAGTATPSPVSVPLGARLAVSAPRTAAAERVGSMESTAVTIDDDAAAAADIVPTDERDDAQAGGPAPWTEAAEQAVGFEGLDPAMVLALRVEDQASVAGRPVRAATSRSPRASAEVTRLDQRPGRLLTPVGPGARPVSFPHADRADLVPRSPVSLVPAPPPATLPTLPAAPTVDTAGGGAVPALPDRAAEPPRAPRNAGDVLVLVGDGVPAYGVAITLAQTLRLPASRVLVAAPDPIIPGLHQSRRLTDAAGARVGGAKLAAGSSAAIVVVDAPASAASEPDVARWVRDVVRALGATAVWAAVDATRRTADVRRWIDAVGPVESVAAYNVAATSDAAELLNLGQPVSLLDGRRANAATWASLSGTPGGPRAGSHATRPNA